MRKIILADELEKQIIDYYLDNHSLCETSSFFILNKNIIKRTLLKYSVELRSKEDIKKLELEHRVENCRQKHGCDYFMQTQEYADKTKYTNLEKYGVEYSFQSENNKDKAAKTKLEKYNNKTFNNREKSKQTCLEKYGVENITESVYFKNKSEEACLKKFGVRNIFASNYFKQLCLHKYGVDSYTKTDLYKQQSIDTKNKNGTFNTSSQEEKYYVYLCNKFNANDIYRQYKIDNRYPFACDFYIKSLDLFIELNLHWSHGGHLFDNTNKDDLKKLAVWTEKAKTSTFYRNAINTWTIRDVEKFNVAKENNLRYIVYYDEHNMYEKDLV